MKARTVAEVMTREVSVARPSWTFKTAARHLRASAVSALPVVDEAGVVVGVVSEADLLLKGAPSKGLGLLGRARRASERRKAQARTVRDLMTSPAITIGPDVALSAAARLMHDRHVKRLPVVDADRTLVGIVSREDLISIFLRPDERIRQDIVDQVIVKGMWLDPREVRVTVADGVVTLEGRLETKSMVRILVGMVAGVDGVVDVDARISYRIDDTHIRPDMPLPWGLLPTSMQVPQPRHRTR